MGAVLLFSPIESMLCELKPLATAIDDDNNAAMTLILIYQCLLSQAGAIYNSTSLPHAVGCMAWAWQWHDDNVDDVMRDRNAITSDLSHGCSDFLRKEVGNRKHPSMPCLSREEYLSNSYHSAVYYKTIYYKSLSY